MITPSLAEVIRRSMEAKLAELRVSMPGRVTAYNAQRETVDVQPQFRRVLEDDDGNQVQEDLPVIPDVPIAWPSGSGGSCFITWPLAKNDTVLLVFNDFDPGMWRETGQSASAGDLRAHGLGGAVAYPGFRSNKGLLGSDKKHASRMVIGASVMLGDGTLGANTGVVNGQGIDTLTGSTYHALGSASGQVFAKK